MKRIILILSLLLSLFAQAEAQSMKVTVKGRKITLAKAFEKIEQQTGYTVAYNSNQINTGKKLKLALEHVDLDIAMNTILDGTGHTYKINGKHLLIIPQKEDEKTKLVDKNKPLQAPVLPDSTPSYDLYEVTVVSNDKLLRMMEAPQMGGITMSQKEIKRIPTLFGEADVIKALQYQPGVSAGTEALAGMYVRGGNGDDNLYMLDGNMMYQVNHLGGLFSAFNTEAIRDVDFYKSSFPAQYGGRLSSVLNVHTKDGDRREYHGSLMLGLTSGNLNIGGPIVKDKTSFNLSLRRSWFELLSTPALAFMNKKTKEEEGKEMLGRYAFTDLNLKLTHRFNPESKAYFNFYYGNDYLKFGDKRSSGDPGELYQKEDVTRLNWGNVLASIGWDYRLNRNLSMNVRTFYTAYSSKMNRLWKEEIESEPGEIELNRTKTTTENGVNDIGAGIHFDYRPTQKHHLNWGVGYTHHHFRPEVNCSDVLKDTLSWNVSSANDEVWAHEWNAYLEEDWTINSVFRLSAGLRGGMFNVGDKTHYTVEPRVSARAFLRSDLSLKASYTRMYQYSQQVSSSYISLPTDYWMPVYGEFKPLESDQISVGLYYHTPGKDYSVSLEAYYKDMKHLLEYRDGYDPFVVSSSWKNKITSGKGWSYGADLMITKETGRLTGWLSYGLLWSERQFDEINSGKVFPAKYDNRHKFNLVGTYKLNDKLELNGSWTFATGNRITLSLENYEYINSSGFPEEIAPIDPYIDPNGINYVGTKNNLRLPAYHRLDLGINIYRPKKSGRMGIWNISIYNVYSRMNPIAIRKEWSFIDSQSGRTNTWFETLGLLPIIPSVSYTYKF